MNSELSSIPEVSRMMFGSEYELLPSVNELFELEMANLEFTVLGKDGLLERSAFFKSAGGQLTHHYLLCSNHGEAAGRSRSAKTKAYFENGKFSTGYSTHSLFPYRGKFHPQLIKGLLNIIGVKAGERILDPMCGSGTANIEAALMGINSFAIDVSPFCQFMTKAKYDALAVDKDLLLSVKGKADELFEFFKKGNVLQRVAKIRNAEKIKVYEISLLAFLDAMGYARRVLKSTHKELFAKVLERYLETIEDFATNPVFDKERLGAIEVLSNSDATDLKINDRSIDGVITSPPYSFAIDYAKNDEAQLEYLGYNVDALRMKMIGLKGEQKREKLENYFRDMEHVCSEIKRVLKKKRYFVLIIGSNTNQTGGIRLENTIIEHCERIGLVLVRSILKPIKGMWNTMKDEYVLIFRKEKE